MITIAPGHTLTMKEHPKYNIVEYTFTNEETGVTVTETWTKGSKAATINVYKHNNGLV